MGIESGLNWNTPNKAGDQHLTQLERQAMGDPDDVGVQERFLVESIRKGRANDPVPHERLFSALGGNSADKKTVTNAINRMNGMLYQFEMKGALVPVYRSREVRAHHPSTTEMRDQRWVSWQCVPENRHEYIPGSIEKILVVELKDIPMEDLIAAGRYDADLLSSELPLSHRSLPNASGYQELLVPKFSGLLAPYHVVEWVEKNGLRGGTLQELLTVGAQFHTEPNRNTSLIAYDKGRYWNPVLDRDRSEPQRRRLYPIARDSFIWKKNFRALAARITNQPQV